MFYYLYSIICYLYSILKSVADAEAEEAVEEVGDWGDAEFEVAEPMVFAE